MQKISKMQKQNHELVENQLDYNSRRVLKKENK